MRQSADLSNAAPLIFPLGIATCLIPITLRLDWNFSFRLFAIFVTCSSFAIGWMDPSRQAPLNQQDLSSILLQTLLILGIAYVSQGFAIESRAISTGLEHGLDPKSSMDVKTLTESQNEIHREIARARRYKRPLGLIAFEPKGNPETFFEDYLAPIHPILFRGFVIKNLADYLHSESRYPDLVIEDKAAHRILCLCWDSDREELQRAANRLTELASKHLTLPIDSGYAVFPNDAVTFDQLVASAYQHLEANREVPSLATLPTSELIESDRLE